MSKSLAIGLLIGASLSPSVNTVFKTLEQRAQDMGRALKQSRVGEAAAADLVKYKSQLDELRGRQQQAGFANVDLNRKIAETQRLFGEAAKKAKTYGISVGDCVRQHSLLKTSADQAERSLARLQARQKNREVRNEAKGKIVGTVGAVMAVAAPLKQAVDFEHAMRATGNIADLADDALSRAGQSMKRLSVVTNQSSQDMQTAWNILLGKGMESDKALAVLEPIGKTATATGASIDDLATSTFAVMDNLKVAGEDIPQVMNILTQAGKEGSFELKDMAQFFPQLTASANALGIGGAKGVASLAAALQVAMKGAGTTDEAANNMKNFLTKVTAPETVKNFAKMGVNLEKGLKGAIKRGDNPIEYMLGLIQKLTKGDKFKIGALFGDMQVLNFLTPMLANMKEYQRIKEKALSSSGVVDQDFANMMSTTKEQWKSLTLAGGNFALTIGGVFKPVMGSVIGVMNGAASAINNLSEQYPALTSGVGYAVMAIAALKVSSLAAIFGATMISDAFNVAVGVFNFFRPSVMAANAALVWNRTVAIGTAVAQRALAVGTALVTAAQWAWNVALAANPIGLVVAGVMLLAGAAYLVVQYWEPIKTFFVGLWEGVKATTMEFVGWIGSVIDSVAAKFSWIGKTVNYFKGEKGQEAPKVGNTTGAGVGQMGSAHQAGASKSVGASLPGPANLAAGMPAGMPAMPLPGLGKGGGPAPAPVTVNFNPQISVSAEADMAALKRILRDGASEIRKIVEETVNRERRLAYE